MTKLDKAVGGFAERKHLLQEQSPCLLQPQLKLIWFCVLAQGGRDALEGDAGGPRLEEEGRCRKHHYASLRI